MQKKKHGAKCLNFKTFKSEWWLYKYCCVFWDSFILKWKHKRTTLPKNKVQKGKNDNFTVEKTDTQHLVKVMKFNIISDALWISSPP